MAIQINGNGTITGISSGGLPAGSVTSATLADGAASGTKLTMPTGSVIQIVEGSTTTSQSPTGGNYVLFLQKEFLPQTLQNKLVKLSHKALLDERCLNYYNHQQQ